MKKLEFAPEWYKQDLFEEVMQIRFDEQVESLVNKLNENYYYWDKVKYYKTEIVKTPELLWAAVKLSRVVNAKKVGFGSHKFSYNLTNNIQRGLHEFDLNIGGNLGAKSIIPEDDKRRYLVSSIMEEAIASSQIEGAVTTRKQAKEMLRKNIKPKTKSEQMIVNNYNTINHIVNIQGEPLTKDKLLTIHKLIVNQTMDDAGDEGVYRDNNDINVIDSLDGEIVHIPPKYTEVPELIDALITFFNDQDENEFIHPIIKGCIIHFMIGYIHPFTDGNGRTARTLFYWYLLKKGYWLTEYLSISRLIMKSKNQYAQAYLYTETDGNDLTYFINYNLKTMQLAYSSLKDYIERKISEKKQIINFQKIDGVNERQAIIMKWIYEEPNLLFSVKEIENRMIVSNQTARTDLEGLVNKGFLQMISLNKKTKGFCRADEFENLVSKELPARAMI
ncbi:cell filamentation protein Fic [Pedobacter sp. HMF7647]|uniref:Cell filamentation protein Fic n=1 Tax=Hufsiella arboris TaxID=2695275 RepID=A0A7K1YD05_9SPHI|nr:Fic family protein [Hufsiella arboris]MXV52455.1 cell filamentation protein Fic [Hufsiella arboris]